MYCWKSFLPLAAMVEHGRVEESQEGMQHNKTRKAADFSAAFLFAAVEK